MSMKFEPSRPAGYSRLVQLYKLDVLPNWHQSQVGTGTGHTTQTTPTSVRETYPAKYWPGDSLGDHLEFALKYDGTNLLILAKLFVVAPPDELISFIRQSPLGKYARRIWYLFELLTGSKLPLDDLTQGNYVDVLESNDYYTSSGIAISRQRVRDNLPGDSRFCPMLRRTARLRQFEQSDISDRCRKIMEQYPEDLLRRALAYLYTKETKSSFEIEHIKPSASRTERFVVLLQLAERDDFVNKAALIELQNRIVDARFSANDYRNDQNYVGETIAWQSERIHFVSPRPQDLSALMEGLIAAHARIGAGKIHPVIHAAAISYAFVFIHPFDDGNGRIHRFLIHNILATRGFTPHGIMFPVSAVMLKRMAAYDGSLEAFSKPLMSLIDYTLDDQGRMTVNNDTADYYRYIDLTPQTEALTEFIRETIEVELVRELRFLLNYDSTKRGIQELVDIPDRLIDLFIRFCLQNGGKLSKRKREEFFEKLTDSEVEAMEKVVAQAYEPE